MHLSEKEWIAVTIAIFVVGFFFIFGQGLISMLGVDASSLGIGATKPEVVMTDTLIGKGEMTVVFGDRVTINYTGRFVDGQVFDSTTGRGEPFQFVVGSGLVIEGLDTGIVGMKVGGKRTITIPPELGYGPADYGPIPGNSTLIFEVELLKIEK